MKLLFDENLSYRLVRFLADVYPGSAHMRDAELLGAADPVIWAFAAENAFVRATKNTDFYQRSLLHGAPPKVVWLRVGNAPTLTIERILRLKYLLLQSFADDPEGTFLTLQPE